MLVFTVCERTCRHLLLGGAARSLWFALRKDRPGRDCLTIPLIPTNLSPRKYDSLIQAQARELSHLRQKLREGRGVSHTLTQHLKDTTKSFEELLRGTDIDYYMGQSFREHLAQGNQLAERLSSKLSSSTLVPPFTRSLTMGKGFRHRVWLASGTHYHCQGLLRVPPG